MKKQMLIDGHQLPVILRRNVVSIDNNPVLWSFINQNPLRNTQKLIDYIQADYQKIFGEKFPYPTIRSLWRSGDICISRASW